MEAHKIRTSYLVVLWDIKLIIDKMCMIAAVFF